MHKNNIWIFNLRKYEREQKKINKSIRNFYTDEQNNALLHIDVANNAIFNPFSTYEDIFVSTDLIEYIEKRAYQIPIQFPIKLIFKGIPNIADQQLITDNIKNYYFHKLIDKRSDLIFNTIKMIYLLVIGVLLLMLSFFIVRYEINTILREFISVSATFSLWEASNTFLVGRPSAKRKYLYAGQLAMAKIEFSK